jgi:Secretion system C-terminal sorting domain
LRTNNTFYTFTPPPALNPEPKHYPMNKLYPKYFIGGSLLILFQFLFLPGTSAQCPFGIIPGSTAFDTTINTPAGINTLQIKVPKIDPYTGMITCLRICVSITGVVDSVSVENNSASPQNADVYYIRTDQITGPGLSSPLSNSINHHYGPYALGGSNGILGSGPDFVAISRDTLLNAVQVCQVVNRLDSLSQFYGHDSVTYTYNITAFTNVTCTGGNYNSTVATSAIVRFRFEFCTCPGYVLPIQVYQFGVTKTGVNRARLSWSGYDDPLNNCYYEPEISQNGRQFRKIGKVEKNHTGNDNYDFLYTTKQDENGVMYFRIKQVYANGYTRFSDIKQITLENSTNPKFFITPNPSDGIVGIKFDNNGGGKMKLEIFNIQGQQTVERDIEVTGSSFHQLPVLQKGMYWVRITDLSSHLSAVSQLIIK